MTIPYTYETKQTEDIKLPRYDSLVVPGQAQPQQSWSKVQGQQVVHQPRVGQGAQA